MAIKMSHLAQHDYLTGLPNRVMLQDRITQAISLASRDNRGVAIMFIDLDRFKYVNDSLGHLVGDKLLKEVSLRLKNGIRSTDSVSRQGGDEFIVMLSQIESVDHVAFIADKLLQEVAKPYDISEDEICITMSIGISLYPEDGDDASTLTKHADTAMYHAKENGRNNVQFFTQSMHERSLQRREVSVGLRNALKQGDLELFYQPKLQLDSDNIVGFEALVRWRHPEKGIIEPANFIAIAEESGIISTLGQWVISEACMQNKRWQDLGLPKFTVAVNISATQFKEKGFANMVKAALKKARLDPKYLELELTESVIMHDVPYATDLLNTLKDIGIKISVDDFGTGYSSLVL
jgi:diguanylate cyclase